MLTAAEKRAVRWCTALLAVPAVVVGCMIAAVSNASLRAGASAPDMTYRLPTTSRPAPTWAQLPPFSPEPVDPMAGYILPHIVRPPSQAPAPPARVLPAAPVPTPAPALPPPAPPSPTPTEIPKPTQTYTRPTQPPNPTTAVPTPPTSTEERPHVPVHRPTP